MLDEILSTKLLVPRIRPEIVPRPHLIDRMNEGLRNPLMLISAPAGFGKTTLLSAWVQQCEHPVAWLSLDESDDDAARFLRCVVAALQTIWDGVGDNVLAMLQDSQSPPLHAAQTVLINEITAIGTSFVMVLDDYHTIKTAAVHDLTNFLIEHAPPSLCVIIATRADPTLQLARFRAHGQLIEFRATDLQFSVQEAAAFLHGVMDLDLSAEDVTRLNSHTEGWIAGLQLAALSMRNREDASAFVKAFAGSNRYIMDYLLEEVIRLQPPEIQEFLLKTSILEPLNASLCQVVTGQANSQATLEVLERDNLFIVPLDDKRYWYRYHHLFADLLRQRLKQMYPEAITELHQKASTWYEYHNMITPAIEHAFAGSAMEHVARLLDTSAETLWGRGEQVTLLRWLEMLPGEVMRNWPRLNVYYAFLMFMGGQFGVAEQHLRSADEVLSSDCERIHPEEETRGMAAVVQAYLAMASGDTAAIIERCQTALRFLPDKSTMWRSAVSIVLGDAYLFQGNLTEAGQAYRQGIVTSEAAGNTYFLLFAKAKLASMLRQQANLREIAAICRELLDIIEEYDFAHTARAASIFAVWGAALCEWNELEEATQYIELAVKISEQAENVVILGTSYLSLARLQLAKGNLAAVHATIDQLDRVVRESDSPLFVENALVALTAWIRVLEGDLPAAETLLCAHQISAADDVTIPRMNQYLAFARLLMAKREFEAFHSLNTRIRRVAERSDARAWTIAAWITEALALDAQGNDAGAAHALEQALVLAEPDELVRTFVDEGPPIARLLMKAAARGVSPAYVRRLWAAFPESTRNLHRSIKTASPLTDPLSEREIEVLQLVSTGATNAEIGQELCIAIGTVKNHLKSIYSKLNAHSRTQATARARELNLLPK
jgi:LuxR family maltose regulon positive regulatory protein